jgi:hypothetical protein
MADHDAGEGTEEEWRFPLSEFEEDGDADGAAAAGPDRAEANADDAGAAADPERIEAGDPSLEGAAFVLLGVAFALFVVSRLFLG